MMANKSPLEIGIVGAGIAGLSAAIALKRAGHAVEVSRERSLLIRLETLIVSNCYCRRFLKEQILEEKQVLLWPSHLMLGKYMMTGVLT